MIYAYPCEGVYGLGCDPDSKKDVFKLCELKKRSIDKGLILISCLLYTSDAADE